MFSWINATYSLDYANDNIHLSINLLGVIVNRLQFSHDNVSFFCFSIESIPGIRSTPDTRQTGNPQILMTAFCALISE